MVNKIENNLRITKSRVSYMLETNQATYNENDFITWLINKTLDNTINNIVNNVDTKLIPYTNEEYEIDMGTITDPKLRCNFIDDIRVFESELSITPWHKIHDNYTPIQVKLEDMVDKLNKLNDNIKGGEGFIGCTCDNISFENEFGLINTFRLKEGFVWIIKHNFRF